MLFQFNSITNVSFDSLRRENKRVMFNDIALCDALNRQIAFLSLFKIEFF